MRIEVYKQIQGQDPPEWELTGRGELINAVVLNNRVQLVYADEGRKSILVVDTKDSGTKVKING
jgi:hypothetical protein